MIRSLIMGLAAAAIALLTPVLLLSPVEAGQTEDRLLVVETQQEQQQEECLIRLETGGEVAELPLETYLVGVLLSEMPMSFEMEALKAQAVSARTFAVRQMQGGKHTGFDVCGQSSCCQAWTSSQALQEKLGDGWQAYCEKAEQAARQTEGEVLTYEGELIDAVYFSCSGGMTEDAVAVWGSEVPYLQSVESPGEETAGKYTSSVTVDAEAFRGKLEEAEPSLQLSGSPESWFGNTVRTEGGGVASMEIGGHSFQGTKLRSIFNLNSTCFTLSVSGQEITFRVMGYGHRVGMSQYGANAMAQAGKQYDEILAHYYRGTQLEIQSSPG